VPYTPYGQEMHQAYSTVPGVCTPPKPVTKFKTRTTINQSN